MRIVRRVSGVMAILVAVTGCAVATHTTATASTTLPTCDKTRHQLNHLTTSLSTKSRIPQMVPGPMRLCRYRWNNYQNKLELLADITQPQAPVALLRTLSQLKALTAVYSPGATFSCMSQGNIDVVILRSPTGSNTTIIGVQRDGCARVIFTHPGSKSYDEYLGATRLGSQLDDVNTPVIMQTKNLPSIRLTPATNFHDGQKVLVQIFGSSPNERFRISECATASAANLAGCGDQLALQPFIDTDPSGSGSTTLFVRTRAATKPYNTKAFLPCTVKCVIMATGTNIEGQSTFVYTSIKFSK